MQIKAARASHDLSYTKSMSYSHKSPQPFQLGLVKYSNQLILFKPKSYDKE